jgi:hypothetical protein
MESVLLSASVFSHAVYTTRHYVRLPYSFHFKEHSVRCSLVIVLNIEGTGIILQHLDHLFIFA